jgi:hypothetical protein
LRRTRKKGWSNVTKETDPAHQVIMTTDATEFFCCTHRQRRFD